MWLRQRLESTTLRNDGENGKSSGKAQKLEQLFDDFAQLNNNLFAYISPFACNTHTKRKICDHLWWLKKVENKQM